jgi:hypothetical protein
MNLKIQIASLSSAYDFEFKYNNGQIIGIVLQSANPLSKGNAGFTVLQDDILLLQLILNIKSLWANPERSSLIILDGIQTTFTYQEDGTIYKCRFNKPEPNTRAAEIAACFNALVAIISADIPFLKDFEIY